MPNVVELDSTRRRGSVTGGREYCTVLKVRGYLPAEGEQIGNLMDSTTEEDNIAELIQRKQELLYVTPGELCLGTMHGGMHGCTRRWN